MEPDSAYAIIYYIIASISILGNFSILIQFHSQFQSTFTSATTYLIYLLHVTSLGQNITTIPILFTANDGLCAFVGLMHYYLGLINLFAMVFIAIIYYRYTTTTSLSNLDINEKSKALIAMRFIYFFCFYCIITFFN